jgi:pimeloyl-ACP methyl ester carboxylesterase
MPFAELKDNIRLHYILSGKGVKPGAVKVNLSVEDQHAAMVMACSNQQAAAATVSAREVEKNVPSLLAVNRPVLTYSYRGSGQSSTPTSLMEYSVDAYREDTQQLAERLGLNKFDLIGYSHGGYFAADYALNYPQQVRALVLVEPALFVDRAKLQDRVKLARNASGDDVIHLLMKQMMPEMAFNSKAYNEVVDAIKANYPNPIGLAGEWYARSTNEIAEKELSQIKVPTLVIGGERSWVRENIERTARFIPGAQLLWLDGTHNLLEERPKEVTAAIESFLGKQTPAPLVG